MALFVVVTLGTVIPKEPKPLKDSIQGGIALIEWEIVCQIIATNLS